MCCSGVLGEGSGGQETSGPMSLLWRLKERRKRECWVYIERMQMRLVSGPQCQEPTDGDKGGASDLGGARSCSPSWGSSFCRALLFLLLF